MAMASASGALGRLSERRGASDDAEAESAILRIGPGSSVWCTGMCRSACRCGQCHVFLRRFQPPLYTIHVFELEVVDWS